MDSPSSSASSYTQEGLSRDTLRDEGDDHDHDHDEMVSHWCALSGRPSSPGSTHWCRRLFVIQWAIDDSSQYMRMDQVWKQLSGSFSSFVENYYGCCGRHPGYRNVVLYRFLVLLLPSAVDHFHTLEDVDELLPRVSDAAVVKEHCWTQCAPCDVFRRQEFLASWTVSILHLGSVIVGTRIHAEDVGLGVPFSEDGYCRAH
jgi:hypothetical protein